MEPSACYILLQDNWLWETGHSYSSWTAKCPYLWGERFAGTGVVDVPVPVSQPSYLSTFPYHVWLSSSRDTLPTSPFIFRPSSRAGGSLSKQQQHTSACSCNMLRCSRLHSTNYNKSEFIFPLFLVALLLGRSLTPLFLSLVCLHV